MIKAIKNNCDVIGADGATEEKEVVVKNNEKIFIIYYNKY